MKSEETVKFDPKYLGVPNICFSLTDKTDSREPAFIEQRLEMGFDDSETWSLTSTFAKFMLPRLKRYQEITKEVLDQDPKQVARVDSVIVALELILKDDASWEHNAEERKQLDKGLKNLGKVFMKLWW